MNLRQDYGKGKTKGRHLNLRHPPNVQKWVACNFTRFLYHDVGANVII